MKLLVETNPLYTTRAGVARYVRNLLQGLRARPSGEFDLGELGWPVENLAYVQPTRALKTLAREWLWAGLVAPAAVRRADVVHHTQLPIIPFTRPARHVVTLHDLALLRHPARFRTWQRHAGRKRLARLVYADRVLCVSRFTADEAMQLLGLPAQRLAVVPHGVLPLPEANATRLPSVATGEFFIFLGSLEPGKNLSLLTQVWRLAAETGQRLPPLVVIGDRWEGVTPETAPPADWIYLGYQDDAMIGALLRRARALLFPSKYEGFGYPVVEAMLAGCPVVCGRVASLPEVGGEAALYSELEPQAFLASVRRLLAEPGLNENLRRLSLTHATKFNLSRCVEDTLTVYDEARRGD